MEFGYMLVKFLLLVRSIYGIVLHKQVDLAKEILLLQRKVAQLEAPSQPQETSSSTYVRWGRTTCNTNGTDLVYKGYMAGHNYLEASGGTEFLCLPQDVTYAQPGPNDSYSGQLYGTEYDMPTEVGSQINKNAPCCLCKTRRPTVAMFPARTNCFTGWTLEYTGYLGAGVRTQTLTNYVCVDSSPETIPGAVFIKQLKSLLCCC